MGSKYSKEHIDYLKKISEGRYNDEITKMFNEKFNMNCTKRAISSLKKRFNIQSNVVKNKGFYTEEHLSYLREITPGRFNAEITKMFNEKFGLNQSESSIQNVRSKHNINTEKRYLWKKGHEPWNKGKKGICTGGKETQFEKGHTPENHRQVGSERIDRDGYTLIKTKEPNVWELKHRVLYEKHIGKIPKDHAVIFADGNKQNLELDNLVLVSRHQLLILNRKGLIQDNKDLTKTAVNIAKVYEKISKRRNK